MYKDRTYITLCSHTHTHARTQSFIGLHCAADFSMLRSSMRRDSQQTPRGSEAEWMNLLLDELDSERGRSCWHFALS